MQAAANKGHAHVSNEGRECEYNHMYCSSHFFLVLYQPRHPGINVFIGFL